MLGDTADLYNKRGIGFTVAEYKRAVNTAIDDAWPLGLVQLSATVANFVYSTPEVTVPVAFAEISAVEWQDTGGLWHVIPKGTRTGAWGWRADSALGQIRIQGDPAFGASGRTLRLTGYGRQDTLTADADLCALNAEWVVARAAYHLAAGAMMKDPAFGQWTSLFMQEAERLKTRIRTQRRPNTERVRP